MLFQFADCVAANLPNRRDNMSVRMDIWGSLNGRFHQRLVDPNEDLLHTTWSPWSPVPWLMPLLRHLDLWRPWIEDAKNRTLNDDVLFFADFPGNNNHRNSKRSSQTNTLNCIPTKQLLEIHLCQMLQIQLRSFRRSSPG